MTNLQTTRYKLWLIGNQDGWVVRSILCLTQASYSRPFPGLPCLQSSGRADFSSGIVWLMLEKALEDLVISLHLGARQLLALGGVGIALHEKAEGRALPAARRPARSQRAGRWR